MSNVTTKQLADTVWAALKADETLAGYVKQWVKGTGTQAGFADVFPYLEFNVLRFTNEPRTIGRRGQDQLTYTCAIDILLGGGGGVVDYLFDGDGITAGKHPGIYQYIDDVVAVVNHKTFDILAKPASVAGGEIVIGTGDRFFIGATIDLECVVFNWTDRCG
jgi:hypothetical protein